MHVSAAGVRGGIVGLLSVWTVIREGWRRRVKIAALRKELGELIAEAHNVTEPTAAEIAGLDRPSQHPSIQLLVYLNRRADLIRREIRRLQPVREEDKA